ncbi:MAG: TIGR00730 family Rossman fold protein [Candidatus Saccharibacteria bacterium]|nr:TIGR00730 family Rossman fold protein [Candidatus Saccharibacteria bacterium]
MQDELLNDNTPHYDGPEFLEKMKVSEEKMLRSNEEFIRAFEILNRHPRRVTVFGSARDVEENRLYREQAYELGQKLAGAGYSVVTGGGNGIMGAANRGAYEAGGGSVGFNIVLPHEQHPNPYTTDDLTFKHFFTRKVALAFFAQAYIYFPGGFGTMDELFEVITLTQTKKMPRLRIILVGSDFWGGMIKFIEEKMLAMKVISQGDEQLFYITDDINEVVSLIGK